MSSQQEPLPRRRSAFTAAFLSLLFPGLGHAYAGAYERALGFAAAPILLIALTAGIALRMSSLELIGEIARFLLLIQVLNVVALVYRVVAAIDAYRVTSYINGYQASGGGRLGRPRLGASPLSTAGLLAVIIVMASNHAVVAYYGSIGQAVIACIFDPTGENACAEADASGSPATGQPGGSASPALPGGTVPPGATSAPAVSAKPWTGGRLNVLLIGADQRPNEGTFNTDTLIVASLDPKTKQVALFSLPRDTVNVPLPPGPAQAVLGTVPCKINSLWTTATGRPDLFPGNDRQRGFLALKDTLGHLYGIDISYYVEVNFDGFKKVVDAVGGVTINVQFPILDDAYPSDAGRGVLARVYIPAGIQHMTGSQALIYARSRHGSIDFDRSQRQQRVLVSLKDQTDVNTLLPKLPDLGQALKTAVHSDMPVDQLPSLLRLAGDVDTANIRSYVFSPPLYGRETNGRCGDQIEPFISKIRQAVRDAFSGKPADEDQREKIAAEGADVWILNGSGELGQASQIAAYLEYQGINASAPNQRPAPTAGTKMVVYNGAELKTPETVRFLEALFRVKATLVTDPSARVDIVITTARTTPDFTPPPAP
jgi:LCP family protein required for cell wall assembly